MLKWLCRLILASADMGAFLSCSGRKWGEEEMPEVLRKKHEK